MTIDNKNRVGIPARFMAMLRELYPNACSSIGYFMTTEGCLRVCPLPVFEKEKETWKKLDIHNEDQRAALIFFTSTAEEVPLDAQNRFKLNADTKSLCNIAGEVVFAGHLDFMQVYDPGSYKAMMNNRAQASKGLGAVSRKHLEN